MSLEFRVSNFEFRRGWFAEVVSRLRAAGRKISRFARDGKSSGRHGGIDQKLFSTPNSCASSNGFIWSPSG